MTRKIELEKFSIKVFVYTCGICVILLLLTLMTFRFAVISWLPSLMGEATEVLPYFFQIAELIAIAVVSGLGYGRYKMCHIILFCIYTAMAVFGFFGHMPVDMITFLIGTFGAILTFPSFENFRDYRQLKETEGWPHFSRRLSEPSEYVPRFDYTSARKSASEPVPTRDIPRTSASAKDTFRTAAPAMESMPELTKIMPKAPDKPDTVSVMSGIDNESFMPESYDDFPITR